MYTYFVGDDQVTLINLTNGNQLTIYSNDARFTAFKNAIVAGEYEKAEKMDTKEILKNFSMGSIKITNGVGTIIINGEEVNIEESMIDRIIKMAADGFDVNPLVKFLDNLYQNPSRTAVQELLGFLSKCELPFTDDGHFIAYKIVRDDYKDIYSGKFDHTVGSKLSMLRNQVDDNRNNTCSTGFHFCSKAYLNSYGSGRRNTDRCMLLKINPANVVSIPSDYNNAKGRACEYTVIGEVSDVEWRKNLAEKDFTDKSVVSVESPSEILPKYRITTHHNNFWQDGKPVSAAYVSGVTGIPVDILKTLHK